MKSGRGEPKSPPVGLIYQASALSLQRKKVRRNEIRLVLGFIVTEILKDFSADLFKYPVHHDCSSACLLLNMFPQFRFRFPRLFLFPG